VITNFAYMLVMTHKLRINWLRQYPLLKQNHVQMCTVQVLNMSSLNLFWYRVTLEKFRLLVPNTTKAKSMKVWTAAF